VSGWSIAAVVVLALAIAFRNWVLFFAFALLMLLDASLWVYFRYYLERAGLEEVDEMTGWEFERWLKRFFARVGFDVETTPYQGDYGADLILTWNGVRIAVQAKRTSRLVGVRAVQEVVAAKAFYDCERAMVVTNGYFTEQAIVLAHANGVSLRSRDDLARKLAEGRDEADRVAKELDPQLAELR
jgi:restriction system protein